jgi:hypothetical protein
LLVESNKTVISKGHAVVLFVEAQRYKSEGRGSIPNGVIGTMALGLTQHLTEMSTRNISWG